MKAGDEFVIRQFGKLVRMRALTDGARALDGKATPYVWATPLRPLTVRGLAGEMVIHLADVLPAELVP